MITAASCRALPAHSTQRVLKNSDCLLCFRSRAALLRTRFCARRWDFPLLRRPLRLPCAQTTGRHIGFARSETHVSSQHHILHAAWAEPPCKPAYSSQVGTDSEVRHVVRPQLVYRLNWTKCWSCACRSAMISSCCVRGSCSCFLKFCYKTKNTVSCCCCCCCFYIVTMC